MRVEAGVRLDSLPLLSVSEDGHFEAGQQLDGAIESLEDDLFDPKPGCAVAVPGLQGEGQALESPEGRRAASGPEVGSGGFRKSNLTRHPNRRIPRMLTT
ncbi:hypothetical protein GCM10027406_07710 [Leifsonia lichenia]